MTGFCSSARFVDHRTPPGHPERADRIRAIAVAVRQAGLIDSPNPFPDFQIDFGPMSAAGVKLIEIPEPAPIDEKWLLEIYSPQHLDRIRHQCMLGGGLLDSGDTFVSPQSFDIAKIAAGAAIECCDAVISGKVNRAFAAVRPPGHHAEPDRPMGFCLFGNVAVAARYLQRAHGIGKVAIVDFDVHHGNGTQAIFESDPSVLFISLHEDPHTCYPGTGFASETGLGPGTGFTLNIPFDPGMGDPQYLSAMQTIVLPRLDEFRPEFLLISAGFDAHVDDPLAHINLSEDGFEQITRLLVQSANMHCRDRIVSVLEGGYDLRALGRSVVRHLIAMT